MEFKTYCQNCGRLITGDNENGTEKNGSLNAEYCRDCYHEGSFTYPKLTWQEIKTLLNNQTRSKIKETVGGLLL
ncbi:MAG TPA: zinc ribbon domain-containing protein [Puia sp.]|nr:zinc ribbon domain-containing protein [Puia sp.]